MEGPGPETNLIVISIFAPNLSVSQVLNPERDLLKVLP
jgi:hypothetical protein